MESHLSQATAGQWHTQKVRILEKIGCHNSAVPNIYLCLLSRQPHLTRIQFVFPLILLVIASSNGIHHHLQKLVVMSILLLCSLNETQENCSGVAYAHCTHLGYIIVGGINADHSVTAGWCEGERMEVLASSLLVASPSLMSPCWDAYWDVIRNNLQGSLLRLLPSFEVEAFRKTWNADINTPRRLTFSHQFVPQSAVQSRWRNF